VAEGKREGNEVTRFDLCELKIYNMEDDGAMMCIFPADTMSESLLQPF